MWSVLKILLMHPIRFFDSSKVWQQLKLFYKVGSLKFRQICSEKYAVEVSKKFQMKLSAPCLKVMLFNSKLTFTINLYVFSADFTQGCFAAISNLLRYWDQVVSMMKYVLGTRNIYFVCGLLILLHSNWLRTFLNKNRVFWI